LAGPKSGGERVAVQALRTVSKRRAIATAFGVRWLQHRFGQANVGVAAAGQAAERQRKLAGDNVPGEREKEFASRSDERKRGNDTPQEYIAGGL